MVSAFNSWPDYFSGLTTAVDKDSQYIAVKGTSVLDNEGTFNSTSGLTTKLCIENCDTSEDDTSSVASYK